MEHREFADRAVNEVRIRAGVIKGRDIYFQRPEGFRKQRTEGPMHGLAPDHQYVGGPEYRAGIRRPNDMLELFPVHGVASLAWNSRITRVRVAASSTPANGEA